MLSCCMQMQQGETAPEGTARGHARVPPAGGAAEERQAEHGRRPLGRGHRLPLHARQVVPILQVIKGGANNFNSFSKSNFLVSFTQSHSQGARRQPRAGRDHGAGGDGRRHGGRLAVRQEVYHVGALPRRRPGRALQGPI